MYRLILLTLPIGLYLLANFAFSNVKPFFAYRLIYYLFFILLFLLLRFVRFNRILPVLTAALAAIFFLYGIVQKWLLFPIYLEQLQHQAEPFAQAMAARIRSGRIFALFTLPTLYAFIIVALLILIFHFFIKSKSGWQRSGWAVLMVLGLVNLLLTQSFGGILLLSVGLFVYCVRARILPTRLLPPLIMVLSLFFFAVVALRFSEARRLEPVKLRSTNWLQAVRVTASSPWFGVGLGNYESAVPRFTRQGEARSIYAHNFLLQFTSESGLLGLAFVLLWLFLYRGSWLPPLRAGPNSVLYSSLFLVLVLFNLIDVGCFFFPAALVAVLILSQLYPGTAPPPRVLLPLLAGFLLVSGLLLLENVSEGKRKQADIHFSQQQFAPAQTAYNRSLALYPLNLKARLGLANLELQSGRLQGAADQLQKVLSAFPVSAYAHYLKSRIDWDRGAQTDALGHAAVARRENPLNRQYGRWYESIKDHLQNRNNQSEF